MAVTNKKAKQKSGTKKSANGNKTSKTGAKAKKASKNKDYIGENIEKNSSPSSRRAKANNKKTVTNKNTKKNIDKNIEDNQGINGEIIAIIALVLGVFFAVAMHTEMTGFVGEFIGKLFRGLFGVVGYLIPYTMIITSVMVFLKKEKPFTKKHMICMVVIFFMINLINAERFMDSFQLNNSDISMIFSMGNNLVSGGILGMYPGKIIETAIGPVGIYLFSIAGIIISMLVALDFSLASMFSSFEKNRQEKRAIIISDMENKKTDFISKDQLEKRRNMKEKLEKNRNRHNILTLVKNEFFSTNKEEKDELQSIKTDDTKAIDPETGEILNEESSEFHNELQINISGVGGSHGEDLKWDIDEDPVKNYPMKTKKDFELEEDTDFDWNIKEKEIAREKDALNNLGNQKTSEKMALSNLENQIASSKSGTAVCGAVASKGISNTMQQENVNGEIACSENQRVRKRAESKDERMEREKSEMEIQANVENKKEQASHYELQYELPDLDLLNPPPRREKQAHDMESLRNNAMTLEKTLKSFHVDAKVINVTKGSSVTRYEVQPAVGTKVSSIVRLSDDIALNLRAKSIRMEAPIPGKAAVGIEIENESREMVSISEMISSEEFKESTSKLSFVVGKDIAGKTVVADLAKMPHMLIAGATGSGKSVCINTIITSILYHAKPNEVKMVLIDPKMVELGNYNGIPHLLIPVVTDSNKAAAALNWAVSEMTDRYKKFAENSVREIKGYNKLMKKNGTPDEVMPQIVIVIDELADLMMVASSLVEEAICRLAQLARAAGIHLIVATQRPSVDVVTGLIKANIPSRIAFMVSSQVDSRTIIDIVGAEKLVGNGDMLFKPQNLDKPIRVQGPFISDEEVENIIQFIKAQNIDMDYDQRVIKEIKNKNTEEKSGQDSQDVLMEDAIRTVIKAKQASVSMLQRRFRIGYNRAARIVDDMEMAGIVGPQDGSRPRTVLVDESYFDRQDNVEEIEEMDSTNNLKNTEHFFDCDDENLD